MSAIILSTEKAEDLRLLTDLAQRLGIQFFTIPKMDARMRARKQLVEWAFRNAPTTEVPDAEIEQAIAETRAARRRHD
jgi:hypothetical protein